MVQRLKITTLVDNIAFPGTGFWAEHGLSFLIEADGKKILFDTGQSAEIIAHNLDALGEDLHDLKYVVLSHGHYDHTGGLTDILNRITHAKLFAHPSAFDDKYVKRGEEYKFIGAPLMKMQLEEHFQLVLNTNGSEVVNGIRNTGQIPRNNDFENVPDRYYIKSYGKYVHDDIIDDQALIIESKSGVIVILGCAHSGVVNTLNHVKNIVGCREIWGVLGGMHLIGADLNRLNETVKVFEEFKVQNIGLSHCTGTDAFLFLSRKFGDRVFLNSIGSVIDV
jgi:7,8-dihydropterin-6-yl-methyl-4-(beta-D-ribofuranosyl)aminobenzene 5'-phosphate synthase